MKPATAQLALLFCVSSQCFAQTPVAAAASPTAKTDDTMVLIRGGTFQMGIDAADIPRFQNIFAIENGQTLPGWSCRATSVTVQDFLHGQEPGHQRAIQILPGTPIPVQFRSLPQRIR
jgi:formylglycine-generating enzyme required for sulfatase activity